MHLMPAFSSLQSRVVRRSLAACGALAIAACGLSCRDPGYRTEVASGQEGSVQVKRIPYDAPAETPGAPAMAAPAAPTDPELKTVESLWPQVSPEDRKRVSDMVQRLAKPNQ